MSKVAPHGKRAEKGGNLRRSPKENGRRKAPEIQNSKFKIENYTKVLARYEDNTTVIEESGIRIAARIGLM